MSKLTRLAETAVQDPRLAARMVRHKIMGTKIVRVAESKTLHVVERYETAHRLRSGLKSRTGVFSRVYETFAWSMSRESGSGDGSALRATEVVRAGLTDLLRRHNIQSLLDAPCGDWNWMQHIDLTGIEYFGADIVPAVIAANEKFERPGVSFVVADLTRDKLPAAEAVLCRDCLQHVSYRDISAILANFRRTGACWLLLTNFPEVQNNRNQFTGVRWRRLNLQLPPFNFPDPIETLSDGGDVNPRQLSLWRLRDLPELML